MFERRRKIEQEKRMTSKERKRKKFLEATMNGQIRYDSHKRRMHSMCAKRYIYIVKSKSSQYSPF
jgi:hypothetical protein